MSAFGVGTNAKNKVKTALLWLNFYEKRVQKSMVFAQKSGVPFKTHRFCSLICGVEGAVLPETLVVHAAAGAADAACLHVARSRGK